MKRGGNLKRTGRLRPVSKKRQQQDKELDDRPEFQKAFSKKPCWICNYGSFEETHHIVGRNHKLRHHRTNLFAVCRRCHDQIIPVLKIESQRALKAYYDADGYDAKVFAELWKAKNGRVG